MIRVFLLAVWLMAGVDFATAQSTIPNCYTGRYANDVFTSVNAPITLTYGHNTVVEHFIGSTNTIPHEVDLALDFYEPSGDTVTKRPLVMLAFGGSYIYNNRTQMANLCIALAKKGYTTATIDYRKIYETNSNILWHYASSTNMADELAKTVSDMKAAIRFMKHNAATYHIDTSKIFIGGYSSGAITALQTAYIDSISEINISYLADQFSNNGGIEGNTDLPGSPLIGLHTYKGIAGVLNISGGIYRRAWISTGNPHLYNIHGTADEVVPYDSGAVRFYGVSSVISLNGSNAINNYAASVSHVPSMLYSVLNGNHASTNPATSSALTAYTNAAATYFQAVICTNIILPVTLSSFTVQPNSCSAVLRWQTATEQGSTQFDIELSSDGNNFHTIATVPSHNAASGSAYMYQYQSSISAAWFRLKMTDKDGNITYSSVQKYRSACGGSSVQIYPNPAQEQATVGGLETDMTVKLLNAQGQTVWSQKAATPTLQIPLAKFINGLYVVQIVDGAGEVVSNTKLIKH